MTSSGPEPSAIPRRGQSRLSLADLAVLLIMFGIVAAVGLPGFNRFLRSLDLNGEVQRTAAMLRVVRQRAITERNDYCVYWDPGSKAATWFDDDDNDGVKDESESAGSVGPYPAWMSIRVSPANPFAADTVVFYPTGSTNSSGSLVFSNTDGYTRTLSIVRLTGMVTVQ
ncbi:MAG TPA: GspH/FimT family protein [Candidatus Eisenbacteria bacterium]|jgi:Tfp pilus assembly protein FimT